jgi:hypothetical protein
VRFVTALQVKLTEGEQARVWRKTTDNVQAWEFFSQGLEQARRNTKEAYAQARYLARRAGLR